MPAESRTTYSKSGLRDFHQKKGSAICWANPLVGKRFKSESGVFSGRGGKKTTSPGAAAEQPPAPAPAAAAGGAAQRGATGPGHAGARVGSRASGASRASHVGSGSLGARLQGRKPQPHPQDSGRRWRL